MSTTNALKVSLRGKALKIAYYYRNLLWQVFWVLSIKKGEKEKLALEIVLINILMVHFGRESVEGRYDYVDF